MTQDNTVILQIFNDIVGATLAQDKLKANGIDSFFENENPIGLNPLGGVELRIFEKDKAAAERLISE